METPLTLNNNAHVRELCFSRNFVLEVQSTLGCYIVETAASIASNDAPYER